MSFKLISNILCVNMGMRFLPPPPPLRPVGWGAKGRWGRNCKKKSEDSNCNHTKHWLLYFIHLIRPMDVPLNAWTHATILFCCFFFWYSFFVLIKKHEQDWMYNIAVFLFMCGKMAWYSLSQKVTLIYHKCLTSQWLISVDSVRTLR